MRRSAISLNGKITLLGVYTNDLGIPADGHKLSQLAFLFIIEGDLNDQPIGSMKIRVSLPSGSAAEAEFPIPENLPSDSSGKRTKWFAKLPLMLPAPILSSGKIDAKVTHDKGEIDVAMPWIVSTSPSSGA